MSRIAGGLAAAMLLLTGCGDDGTAGCTELREPEDPASVQHVIGNGTFEFLSHPPTSGPHVGGESPTGVVETPLTEPVQVRILEAGVVLVQYEAGELDGDQAQRFASLGAVVAPAEDLPAPVVATAWTWKLTCDELDAPRIEQFVNERAVAAPRAD
jgi:hypothetical protein